LPQFASALAFLACRVADRVPCGDHVLIIAEVLDGALQHPDDQVLAIGLLGVEEIALMTAFLFISLPISG
jgi:flavin reductase (DIM6/NTAB) family NADH-FMN oxidoreductase RutF